MIIVLSVAAAAALVVVAYSKVREHEPATATAGLRAVRDLADVVLVCVKAIEGVVDVLARSSRGPLPSTASGAYEAEYEADYGLEDEPL